MNALTSLKPGEFFALGGLVSEPTKVKIRARETRHGGMTPKLNPAAVRPSVEKILESIQTATPLMLAKNQETVALPKQEIVPELPAAVKVIPLGGEIKVSSNVREISHSEEADESKIDLLPMDDFLDWDNTRKTTGVLGLTPLIERESVPSLLKLEESYKLFGQKENVTRVGLAFRPLVEVGVRIRSGVIKKKFETK